MTIKYPISSEKDFLTIYLTLYNAVMPPHQRLVPSELELMVDFALLPEQKFQYQRFSTLAKNTVIRSTDRKLTKVNINNKIYSILDKGFLKRDEDGVIYMPKHFLQALSQYRKNPSEYSITLKFQPIQLHQDDSKQDNSDIRADSSST